MKGGIFRLVLTGISFCFSGPLLFWSWFARLTVTLLLSAGRQLSSSTGRKENCYRPRATSSALPQPRLLSTIASEDCDDAPRMPSSIGLPANVGRHSNNHEVRAPAKSRLQKCAHRKCRMPELTGSSQLNCSTDALEQSGPVFERLTEDDGGITLAQLPLLLSEEHGSIGEQLQEILMQYDSPKDSIESHDSPESAARSKLTSRRQDTSDDSEAIFRALIAELMDWEEQQEASSRSPQLSRTAWPRSSSTDAACKLPSTNTSDNTIEWRSETRGEYVFEAPNL